MTCNCDSPQMFDYDWNNKTFVMCSKCNLPMKLPPVSIQYKIKESVRNREDSLLVDHYDLQ